MLSQAKMRPVSKPDIKGIHAVLYAFFDRQERLDRTAMRAQVDACVGVGVDAITVLGLATEGTKLSLAERLALIDWTAQDVAGRVPLGITISGQSVAEQIGMVRSAEAAGASLMILQPPMTGNYGASEYLDFFSRVMDATTRPVAIQNAPQYLGRGLTGEDIAGLMRRHANLVLIKAEGSATDISGLVAQSGAQLAIFNGRGGLELMENLRAGASGFILAPDLVDYAVAAMKQFDQGDEAAASAFYARMAPAIVFVMQSIETLICYGKRLFAARAGLDVIDRAPALRPTAFGLQCVAQHAAMLGPFRQMI